MGGGSGSFEMGRPAEVRPVTFAQGVNLYSGAQSSLAGSLPSWIAWFSPAIEYELGSLVHFNEVTNVYEHKYRHDFITETEWNIMDSAGQDEYEITTQTPAQIVKRDLFSTEFEGKKLGDSMPIGDNLPLIMTYFDYSKETIFVCTKDGAKMTVSDFNATNTRQSEGFWSLKELEVKGWNVGFTSSKASDPQSSLDVSYEQIILNLTDITASVVSVGDPQVVACNAILSPQQATEPSIYSRIDAKRRGFGTAENSPALSNPNSDPIDLGVCEIKLIPTDKISFGGGIVRTPVSRADMAVKESVSAVGEETNFISPVDELPFLDLEGPYAALLDKKEVGVIDPRYGEASTSLNAFLGSIYFHAFPQGGMATTLYWVDTGRDYIEGETVRYAYNTADTPAETPNVLNKKKKDCMWICRKSHTSNSSNAPPLMGEAADTTTTSLLSNDYWQPYTRLINQPNTSLGDLHQLYKDSGQIMQKPVGGTGIDTVKSGTVNSPRKRMSDLIGGSKLYGHLTIGPMGAITKTRIDFKCRRRRCTAGYIYLPPGGRDPSAGQDATTSSLGATSSAWLLKYLGGMDLWLFPNNFKKDHGGQIKYAVGFYDHISYNIETAWGSKRKSWFKRVILHGLFGLFGGRKSYDWSTTETFSRSHFQTLTNIKQLEMDNTHSFDYSKSESWSAGTPYNKGHVVKKDNLFYRSQIDSNLGNTPQPNQSKWENIVDTSGIQENDILRFSFRYLTGFCDQRDVEGYLAASGVPKGHYYVSGYYEVVIQDLNSGNVVKPSFRYLDLMSIPVDNQEDSYERTWSGGTSSKGEGRATYNYDLWKEYMDEADKVASKFSWSDHSTGSSNAIQSLIASTMTQPSQTTSLKLICTRNWYNWMILGSSSPMANALNANEYYKPLIIKSMDVPESVFKSLCGLVHTGFRNMDFSQIQDAVPGQLDFSLPAAFEELASGVTLPNSVELEGDDKGAFTISKDVNQMPNDFISSLKSYSTTLEGSASKIYKPGEVVEYLNKFYYIKEVISGLSLKEKIDE